MSGVARRVAELYGRRVIAVPRLVRITLVKSPIKASQDIKYSISLRKINQSIVHKNIGTICGIINKVTDYVDRIASYYVDVEDVPLPPKKYPVLKNIPQESQSKQ